MRFVSARDGMYQTVVWGSILLCVAVILYVVFTPYVKSDRIVTVVLLVPTLSLLVSMYFGTYYEVQHDHLIIRCGPFRQTLSFDRITAIAPTRSIYSAPALSRDRLQVSFDTYGKVQISPADRTGFLAAMGYPPA